MVFNRTNSVEQVGKSAVYKGEKRAVFASYLIRFRIKKEMAKPVLLCSYINSSFGRAYILSNITKAIGQVNINAQIIGQLPIPLPPLEEQEQIVDRLNWAEEIKKTNAESDKKIEELKSSLLQRAFRGEL